MQSFLTFPLLILFVVSGTLFAKEKEKIAPVEQKGLQKTLKPQKRETIYSHFLSGLVLERYGKLDQAVQKYTRVLELDPSATLIYQQRAKLYLKMGEPAKALPDAQSYVRLHPEEITPRHLLSEIHILLGQQDTAQLILEKILEKNPDHSKTLMELATLLFSKDPRRSTQLFERLIQLEPSSTEAYYRLGLIYQQLGKLEKSKEILEKAVQIDQGSISCLLLLGQISEKNGEFPSAIQYYENTLKKMPENFSLRLQLLTLYFKKSEMAKIEELLEDYKKESAMVPVEANIWLGIVYENKKDWKKALSYYLRAKKQANTVEVNIHLASIYSQLRDGKKALQSLNTILKESPENPQFQYFLGVTYLDLNKPRKAIKPLKRALELKKDFSSAYFKMGVALDSLKKWDEAESMFREAIRIDSTNASSYNYIGYTYAQRNERLPETRKLIERALELDPDNPAYIDSLGWLEFREGHFMEALNHLLRASEGTPEDPIILEHLGDCYHSLKNFSESAKSYLKSLELDPKNKVVQKKLKKMNQKVRQISSVRKMLEELEVKSNKILNLSGTLLFQNVGNIHLISTEIFRGFFYLRKNNSSDRLTANPSPPLKLPIELRIDLMGHVPSPTPLLLILRYQENPKIQWTVFPPEFKNQMGPEIEVILEMVTSFFSGEILRDFDPSRVKLEEKSGFFILTNGDHKMRLEKKRGVVSEITIQDRSIQIDHFQKVGWVEKMGGAGSVWLPETMTLRWPILNGTKFKMQKLQIRLSHISLEKIEDKIFAPTTDSKNQ